MTHEFEPGDFLVFQIESGFGLLRVLATVSNSDDCVWHLALYRDLFQDIAAIEEILEYPGELSIDAPHLALTNRAFESTQVSKLGNHPLTEDEIREFELSREGNVEVSDRSIRLLMGIR